jgi:hypothetical protein
VDRCTLLKGLDIPGLALTSKALEPESWAQSALLSSATFPTCILETLAATLRIAERTGDLAGSRRKDAEVERIHQPRLGENLQLVVPKTRYEAAHFCRGDQQFNHIEEVQDGVLCTFELHCRRPFSENDRAIPPRQLAIAVNAIAVKQ